MLEASKFSPSAKQSLNASRHERAMTVVRDLDRHCKTGFRVDPRIISDAELIEALVVAMATAPNGEVRHKLWKRYCKRQATQAHAIAEIVDWLYRSQELELVEPTMGMVKIIRQQSEYVVVLQTIYMATPDDAASLSRALSADWADLDLDLVAAGLLRAPTYRSMHPRSWQTALGRAVVGELEDGHA